MTRISDDEVEGRVRSTIGRVFRLPPADDANELQMGNPPQWDSLGHMQLLVEIENEFGIRFQTHEIAGLTTSGKLAAAVRAHSEAQR
ncbi:MAG TPA: acyl carrier protein [Pyrinomonadaceae bacterium]|nr:acyl carrier protein [Pyrinomonadaceae bacterium]